MLIGPPSCRSYPNGAFSQKKDQLRTPPVAHLSGAESAHCDLKPVMMVERNKGLFKPDGITRIDLMSNTSTALGA